MVGRRRVPDGLGRPADDPLDALRWNTPGDVALALGALAGLPTPLPPSTETPTEAGVYQAHRCPDLGSRSASAGVEKLRAFYEATAGRGGGTLHALD